MPEVEGCEVTGVVANHLTWGQKGAARHWILQFSDQRHVGVKEPFPIAEESDTCIKRSVSKICDHWNLIATVLVWWHLPTHCEDLRLVGLPDKVSQKRGPRPFST